MRYLKQAIRNAHINASRIADCYFRYTFLSFIVVTATVFRKVFVRRLYNDVDKQKRRTHYRFQSSCVFRDTQQLCTFTSSRSSGWI